MVVPISAVTTNGNRHTVDVVEGDTSHSTNVGVGTVGSEWAQITSGLRVGEKVALADLGEPVAELRHLLVELERTRRPWIGQIRTGRLRRWLRWRT